jgi:hypothetical protein
MSSAQGPRHRTAPTYLVEIKHQVQLAHIAKERIQHLHKEVDSLEIRQFVVIGIDTHAEEQPCIPPVHDLQRPKLYKVALVLLVARRD